MDIYISIFYAAAGIPALVSTGVTILYFLLKVLSYITDAISDKAQRRETMSTTSICEQKYSGNKGGEGGLEIQQQIQEHFSERA